MFKQSFFNKFRYNKTKKLSRAITSYGLILFTIVKNELKFLLMQRRNTISYIEFLKNNIKPDEMIKYMRLMSLDEKRKCVSAFNDKNPMELWDDLYINHFDKYYLRGKNSFVENFNKNMQKYMPLFKNDELCMSEKDWGIPKGRKTYNETYIETALREFKEETGIDSANINLIGNRKFEELYIGSDGKLYKSVYFLAYTPKPIQFTYNVLSPSFKINYISDETASLSWDNLETCRQKLDEKKFQIIETIHNMIRDPVFCRNNRYICSN